MNKPLMDAVAQLSAELGFCGIGRTVDVQLHSSDFAKAFPEALGTSILFATGAGPSIRFAALPVESEDIPAVGQRARDAANTAPLRLAAHGETK